MKKIILSLLLLLFPFSKTTASTKITIEPVSNTIVDKIAASGYFSFKATQDGVLQHSVIVQLMEVIGNAK